MFNPKDMLLSAYGLVILSSGSIICNILLLLKGKITTEVKLSGGFIGGLVVLIPAVFQKCSGSSKCCSCCGRCQAVVLEALGIAGALYNFGVTTYGLMHGHHCEESKCSVLSYRTAVFWVQMVVSGVKIILCSFRCVSNACCKDRGSSSSCSPCC